MTIFIAVIILLSTLTFVGCNNITATDGNSYVISVYKTQYEQKENGEVVFKGYDLKNSLQVIMTQMLELDYEIIEVENPDGEIEKKLGKYQYLNLPSDYEIIENKKLQMFPSSNATIFVREREKKSINIYYQGKEVNEILTDNKVKEEYNKYFKDTYTESFVLPGYEINAFLGNVNSSVRIELYTNADFEGEPFATKTLEYSSSSGLSGTLYFNLIKTTNVYVKVI